MSEQMTHSFDWFLNRLKNDPNINRNDLRTIIETLIKIYKNLVTNKDNEKYRKVNVNNPNFRNNVWRHPSAQDLLLSQGWTETNDHQSIVFSGTDSDVNHNLSLLVDNRNIRPDANDWVNTGQQFSNPSEQREQELKERALKEKIKDLEAFERDKRERQLIQENVKKEIESDIRFRKMNDKK